jgi:hypothetical protein
MGSGCAGSEAAILRRVAELWVDELARESRGRGREKRGGGL